MIEQGSLLLSSEQPGVDKTQIQSMIDQLNASTSALKQQAETQENLIQKAIAEKNAADLEHKETSAADATNTVSQSNLPKLSNIANVSNGLALQTNAFQVI